MFEVPTVLGLLGWHEMLLIGLVAVLLFGRRLPDVGRSLGRGIVELKKGLRGVADEIESTGQEEQSKSKTDDEKI
ncbi:MAG: twin-arginine translocase TatA/TatE family subunit [Phycisphaerae bacterium]|nr:twin-arginine translocase TatA/TatE family subunit [Phycisphaerae bacterium]